ncbi:AraC family transcriptional regulator [uncultured Maricaulis sp.]|uniref:helix-turn-helix domain-containing protein n=1 Tax=uncultured Maricaulis sp. TaxID=174710 RepID=UPI0025CFB087|nr:AraC family transcriptional regulator [uncultured Maricaulis sp.]
MTTAAILEILARGGTAGLALMMALIFLRDAGHAVGARLGLLFALGVAGYALVSSNLISEALGPAALPLNLLAIPTGVLFWWFATALFDDRFVWRSWRLIPLGLIILAATGHFLPAEGSRLSVISILMWQAVNILLMAHAAVLAIRDWPDDLIEPRRRFRIALAGLVAILGITISVMEVRFAGTVFPDWVFQAHGMTLFGLAVLFTGWLIAAPTDLFPPDSSGRQPGPDMARLAPEDRPLAARLEQAMADGLYREPGLTVGVLAEHLDTREHRLRRLINQGLGFRNFSAFLNKHRLAEAKRLLASPERAHDQVLTLALDLGYGSIAPFNRAFRAETGTTPTLFRRAALARA